MEKNMMIVDSTAFVLSMISNLMYMIFWRLVNYQPVPPSTCIDQS
ncbi:hypothetical protein CUZ98_2262 [Enterococcus faecium]|nr:hypothetical protein [Enterococcus faecium]